MCVYTRICLQVCRYIYIYIYMTACIYIYASVYRKPKSLLVVEPEPYRPSNPLYLEIQQQLLCVMLASSPGASNSPTQVLDMKYICLYTKIHIHICTHTYIYIHICTYIIHAHVLLIPRGRHHLPTYTL